MESYLLSIKGSQGIKHPSSVLLTQSPTRDSAVQCSDVQRNVECDAVHSSDRDPHIELLNPQ